MPRVLFSGSSSYAKASFLKFRFHAYLCLLLIYKSPTQSVHFTLYAPLILHAPLLYLSAGIFLIAVICPIFIYILLSLRILLIHLIFSHLN